MRAALPGTKHTAALDRREQGILNTVGCAPGVKKVKAGRIARTGATQRRLQLRYGKSAGAVEGWLFIGTGKRLVLIYPVPHLGLETLGRALALTLDRYKVLVQVETGA